MNPIVNLKAVLQQVVRCLGGCLFVVAGASATDSGTTTVALRSATWQEAVQYVIQRLPACTEYPQSAAVVSIRRDRVTLYYADHYYGTTDSFPLRVPFTAEAHSSGGSWRLFVRFRKDVVTTDVPYLKGHGQSDVFFCDGERDTTEGVAAALTRLRQLLTGERPVEQEDSPLPEIIVQDRREASKRSGDGELITLTARVDTAGLDLSTPRDADELRARVSNKAHDLCRRLENRDPDSDLPGRAYETRKCVRDAIAGATKRVDELVASAQKRQESPSRAQDRAL
jgi:UrcA family protein